ncbi:MAG: DUF2188 domain-containing protein [Candidatus Aminicenantes bacterium]|nr:DUF2188 domain-containing protein [Candidatus Aminicenantes bacterium]
MNDIKEKKIAHVIKRGKRWAIVKHNAGRASKIYELKEEAIKNARKLKKTGHDVVIHKWDGTVEKWENAVTACSN